jgi:ParB family chromosome partitioning protein
MASIAEKGLLHPIVVRPVERRFEVVAGMRRLEACKRLGIKKIPCHIAYLDEREAFEVSLIENLQRNTLDVLEEARAFKKYVDDFGYGSVTELAKKIGKSEPYVSQRIGILGLPKDILHKVIGRLITPSHAVELLGLKSNQQKLVSELVVKQRLSSKDVRRLKKHMIQDFDLNSSPYLDNNQDAEKAKSRTSRMLRRCILLLKTTLIKLDFLLEHIDEEEWMVKETLLAQSRMLHKQIDSLLLFEKKVRRFQKI